MNVYTQENALGGTFQLARQFFSPLCGIGTRIGCFLRDRAEPSIISAGAQITGVHLLLNRPAPTRSYHIGGSGLVHYEAFIKAIAESMERYNQLIGAIKYSKAIQFTTFKQLEAQGEETIDPDLLRYFTPDQLASKKFPFKPLQKEDNLSFIKIESLCSGKKIWVPAQLLLIGYNVNLGQKEPWLASAVTTGTATHTDPIKALKNALLELIQLDSAMGHWYGSWPAIEIKLDQRTKNLQSLLDKMLKSTVLQVFFYYLPNADLKSHTIACLLGDTLHTPAMVVGLGSDTHLEKAMYKAFLEANACLQLAKFMTFQELFPADGHKKKENYQTGEIYDLDRNVFFYAHPKNSRLLKAKFDSKDCRPASKLPADLVGSDREITKELIQSFKNTGKELLFMDLTTPDVKSLGFVTHRVWSPDTLSLSLPSCPALAHVRYQHYKGISHADVHPYP